jgi:ABC-type polysaccharide/polyol phosphate export permease
MSTGTLRQFGVFFNKYYWQTAVLIARNGLARQYRNSFLGMFWTMLQPLTMVMVYITIMPLVMRLSSVSNYPLYIIVSLPLWNFFSGTLIASSQSILANGETLKRCMISSTVFPVADVLRSTYMLGLSFATMYMIAVLLGHTSLTYHLLLLPLFFLPVLIIMLAISIAVAFIAPYIRDIGELVVMGMTITFWLTPVIYTPEHLPPNVMNIMVWNPFYVMMHPLQMLAYEQTLPDMASIARLLALMLVAIAAGFAIFRVCRRNYVYYL